MDDRRLQTLSIGDVGIRRKLTDFCGSAGMYLGLAVAAVGRGDNLRGRIYFKIVPYRGWRAQVAETTFCVNLSTVLHSDSFSA